MKTTLDIDDRLLTEAKTVAARERKTLTSLIEEGLTLRLRTASRPATRRQRVELPVFRGQGGLAAGIDPKSNASLFDAADS